MIRFVSMKKCYFLLVSVLLLFLISCSGKNKSKTKHFDLSREKKNVPHIITVIKPDSLLFWKQRYQSDSVNIKFDSISPFLTRHFIDRFNAKTLIKNKLYFANDSITHYRWGFKDSTEKNNAFYNWLDCFGKDCISVKLYEPFKSEKKNALIFINQKSISYITGRQILSKDLWMNFEKTVFAKDSLHFLIIQQPGKNAVWYRYQKNKFNLIKK